MLNWDNAILINAIHILAAALSYLIWKFLNIKDKMVTRATLVAILLHFSSLCAVDLLHAIRSGQWSTLVDVKVRQHYVHPSQQHNRLIHSAPFVLQC